MSDPKYGYNPFRANLELKGVVHSNIMHAVRSSDENSKSVTDYYTKDREANTKFYRSEARAQNLNTLKQSGWVVFNYIMNHLRYNEDIITMKRDSVMEWGSLKSAQTFYNARQELYDIGVIAHYTGNKYWINPAYIFNGNRLTYAKKHNIPVVMIGSNNRINNER